MREQVYGANASEVIHCFQLPRARLNGAIGEWPRWLNGGHVEPLLNAH